ncbi:Na+/H+ antiporter [Bradyrhizobium sp. LHD-71]|uniref:Na+/H+ antiporter n=1 Tax=Bradyrhizobium sp. LHD-71 TaxID=3072141 RepID=UPI00280DC88E|nr:Na+/H+ antiporter [Bradyrhizobium sp. LHD-71]MDQ8730916.1 Na+/H+ antiporter [Bradyrhizobium sp. LHD-71]
MEAGFQIFLVLLAVLASVALLARKLDIAPAVLLLVTGIGLAFIPGLPRVELAPDLVLLLILPPLIYSASVAMSWRDFKANLRPIALLAIGCVIFTACAVATATHYLIGLPWSVGFLLGAIVAPPDVVAPLAIARRLRLPRRILIILEGEGLANDATALILYRFAVVAISTGAFSLSRASATFTAIVASEVVFGLAVGWLSLRLRRWADSPKVEIIFSLITPYIAFWVPEHLGGSGVLATVACGLYISWNGPLLISSATRLQGIFFWDLVIYLTEGALFLLTGFQMRLLIEKSKAFPLTEILGAIALVSVVVVVARFAWVFPGTYLSRFVSGRFAQRDPWPPWRQVFIIAFTGVRGAVSLAAALALPLALPGGEGFPYRDMILFVAFGVIFVTLVGLGLTLPLVVKLLGVSHFGNDEYQRERVAELVARREALENVHATLLDIVKSHQIADEIIDELEARHQHRWRQLPNPEKEIAADLFLLSGKMHRKLIQEERHFLHAMLRDGRITDETRRRIEHDLDLEEASIGNREHAGMLL